MSKELSTYLELQSVHFEVDDGRVVGAWLESEGHDALDIYDHLTAYELDQLQAHYAEWEVEEGERIQAMREDAADARRQDMREIAREEQQQALKEGAAQRGIRNG